MDGSHSSSEAEIGHAPADGLTLLDLSCIAFDALRALPRDHAREIAIEALGSAGHPLVPFLDVVDDAKWWAGLATQTELRAYAAHAFLAMPKGDRRDFLAWGAEQ